MDSTFIYITRLDSILNKHLYNIIFISGYQLLGVKFEDIRIKVMKASYKYNIETQGNILKYHIKLLK